MVATSGDRLLAIDAVEALRDILIPRALVVTPNLHEAAALTGRPLAEDEIAMRSQGEELLERGARAVLVKGGHGSGEESVDLLVTPDGVTRFAAPRIATRNTHGTGCTLSAAIAAGLAKGRSLVEATGDAKDLPHRRSAGRGSAAYRQGSGPGAPLLQVVVSRTAQPAGDQRGSLTNSGLSIAFGMRGIQARRCARRS